MVSAEQLLEIENFASLLLSPNEVALAVGIDPEVMLRSIGLQEDEIYKAYMKGHLRTVAENNRAILQMAKAGSSPAQKELLNLMKSVLSKMNLNV